MSYTDYHFAERLMDLRVQQEHRQAGLRRLSRQAQGSYPDSAPRLGNRLISLCRRLLGSAFPQALAREEAGLLK